MKITSSSTITQALAETPNAKYSIEYTLSGHNLMRVTVTVFSLQKNINNEDVYLGTISNENDMMNSSLLVSSNIAAYMNDFEQILNEIKEAEPNIEDIK